MTTDERPEKESTVELLGGLIGDAKDLAVAHLDGLRNEVKEELRDLKVSTKYAAAAAAIFAVGAILAAFAIAQALWLYTRLPSWLAYGLIAATCFAAGAALLVARSRKSKDIDLVPETEILRMKRDAKWIANRTRDAVT